MTTRATLYECGLQTFSKYVFCDYTAHSREHFLHIVVNIWKVLRSNLGTYPEWVFSWLSSAPPSKCWDSTLNQATTAPVHIPSNSSVTNHPFIRRCIHWVTENASLNTLQTTLHTAHKAKLLLEVLQQLSCIWQNKTTKSLFLRPSVLTKICM
jgi:hypothetical protein